MKNSKLPPLSHIIWLICIVFTRLKAREALRLVLIIIIIPYYDINNNYYYENALLRHISVTWTPSFAKASISQKASLRQEKLENRYNQGLQELHLSNVLLNYTTFFFGGRTLFEQSDAILAQWRFGEVTCRSDASGLNFKVYSLWINFEIRKIKIPSFVLILPFVFQEL